MTHRRLDATASCSCGRSHAEVHGRPLLRAFCHCTVCQAVYKAPFSDYLVFWATAVSLPPGQRLDVRHLVPHRPLDRGLCRSCEAPVAAFLQAMPFVRLAWVPTRNFPGDADLPSPQAHIYYDTRVRDAADDLPKASGQRDSLALFKRLALRGALPI